MNILKMGEIDVKTGIKLLLKSIDKAYLERTKLAINAPKPLLVAVSKTKPVELIIDAYAAGQRHFGENYVQELIEKSENPKILTVCPDIKWHFIGHLQNNKVNKLLKCCRNLHMIQTVDNEKLANNLNSAWEKIEFTNKSPLKVLVQVKTSGEEAKHGVKPSEAPALFKHIRDNLSSLQVEGIMTIGAYGHSSSKEVNPDFVELMNVHRAICEEYDLAPDTLQVSMGMSHDFEQAIGMGSTIIRVGSSIFGDRAKMSI